MKLISVQSRGNRLVRIEKDSQVEGVGGFSVIFKRFSKRQKSFIILGFERRGWINAAMNVAENWLKGATV